MDSTLSTTIALEDSLTVDVSPVFRFMRPACEVHSGTELLAFMSGSTWKRAGEIIAGNSCYHVGRSTMLLRGSQEVATYEIAERFMRLTRVHLVDLSSGREFEFRQKRMWCGTLVLFESGLPVAEYVSKLFQSRYRIVAVKETPESVLLLSIWLAVVAGVFRA